MADELPEIVLPSPVVVPAVAEKMFASGYIVQLQLGTGDTQGLDQGVTIWLRPYDEPTKTLYPDSTRDITHAIANIWTEAARVPLFAQVLGGIVQVSSLLVQERYYQAIIDSETSTVEEKAAAEAAIAPIRTSLGIA